MARDPLPGEPTGPQRYAVVPGPLVVWRPQGQHPEVLTWPPCCLQAKPREPYCGARGIARILLIPCSLSPKTPSQRGQPHAEVTESQGHGRCCKTANIVILTPAFPQGLADSLYRQSQVPRYWPQSPLPHSMAPLGGRMSEGNN